MFFASRTNKTSVYNLSEQIVCANYGFGDANLLRELPLCRTNDAIQLTVPSQGPYFAWVSGSIGGGAQTNPAFAIALTIVTVIVLLGLVRVQRAMEDPFTSHFPGDVIDLVSEQLDTETRLNLIVACAR